MNFRLQNLLNLPELVRELENGLRNLRLQDNFNGFLATATIDAGSEYRIANRLKTVPTGYIILKQSSGDNVITAGDTEWSSEFLYMKNNGTTSATITIFFIR